MKLQYNTLYLKSPNATTPVPWVNNQPDFTGFTEPTLSILKKAWQDFLDSGGELDILPEPESNIDSPTANWDMFNHQMMSNPRFNKVFKQCQDSTPIITAALPTALDQITNKGLNLFNLIWTQFCQNGGATEEDRLIWAEYAEANNLPQEFVNILKGV